MHMPTVGSEQKKLNELWTGTWRGEERLWPSEWDPKGGAAFGTWVVHPSLDGFSLVIDYTEERDGKVAYRGHGIHTWDPNAKTFLAYWFDNIGVPPTQGTRATLEANRYWYETDEGPQGWTRMSYQWTDNRLEFRIEKSKDSRKTWQPVHEGRYTRWTW
jgi:hypothetical protein